MESPDVVSYYELVRRWRSADSEEPGSNTAFADASASACQLDSRSNYGNNYHSALEPGIRVEAVDLLALSGSDVLTQHGLGWKRVPSITWRRLAVVNCAAVHPRCRWLVS